MITRDDIRLVLAYFHLHAPRRYCPHEIAYRRGLRIPFLRLARQILGEVPDRDILLQLVTLNRQKRRK